MKPMILFSTMMVAFAGSGGVAVAQDFQTPEIIAPADAVPFPPPRPRYVGHMARKAPKVARAAKLAPEAPREYVRVAYVRPTGAPCQTGVAASDRECLARTFFFSMGDGF